MRIGALDWNQPFKDSKKNEKSAPPQTPRSNPMISSPSDNISNNGVSNSGIPSNVVPQNGATRNSATPVSAAPVASTGAPGSGSMGAPGSGVPGAARGGRTVMWKGKTLNMDTTRSALLQAAQEEQRVAQTEAATTNGVAPMDAGTQALHEHIATILTGMNEMCGGLQEIYGTVSKIADRDSNNERVFNTLHAELSDYKKDFIYEHLKPVIRPLLFLYDSLEQFESETQRFGEAAPAATSSTQSAPTATLGMMPTRAVRQNTVYFREQLVEALRICEVTPMDTPSGAFNARFHKAVKTTPVAPEMDGQIQGVIRSGWFLNGQLLRAAEVVVGKTVASG